MALSCDEQHFCPAAGSGHSATAVPSVTPASATSEPHWQNDDDGAERHVYGVHVHRDCTTQQTPRSVSPCATDVGLHVVI